MNEDAARAWIATRVPRETYVVLERLERLIVEAGSRQNLVSAGSATTFWSRHIVDSAQLLDVAPGRWTRWADLGTGAGFPGMVIALLSRGLITLIESRRLRAEHLRHLTEALSLKGRVTIVHRPVERIEEAPFDVISARAFAPLPRLFAMAHHLSDAGTIWVLPKGRRAAEELAVAEETWQGKFSVVPSVTDTSSSVIVAEHVRRRKST